MPIPLASPVRAILLAGGLALLAGCSGTPAVTAGADGMDVPHAHSASGLRLAVVRQAQAMLGTPYRYGGNGPHGFDCSGLVQYSHARTGIAVPRMARDQRRHARPVPLARLQPGDLVFFALEGPKGDHVGIYVGRGEFIHAPSSGKRVSRSRLDQRYWRERLVAAGSYL
jgi:cell wall-associated NlpC family hydrolase